MRVEIEMRDRDREGCSSFAISPFHGILFMVNDYGNISRDALCHLPALPAPGAQAQVDGRPGIFAI
jgi:hypothetical protein